MNTLRNQVQLIGNLGNAPEIFTFKSGKKKATLSIATNETYYNAAKEKVEETQWHRVVFFGKQIETIEKYFEKGMEIAIGGKITYSDYTDKDGIKRYVTEIIGNDFLMLGSKK